MGTLVWLFAEHREAVALIAQLRAQLQDRDYLTISLKGQLAQALERANSPSDILENYRKDILAEEPFKDGVVPDAFWLTPGDV